MKEGQVVSPRSKKEYRETIFSDTKEPPVRRKTGTSQSWEEDVFRNSPPSLDLRI
jgi:hypothetical protein